MKTLGLIGACVLLLVLLFPSLAKWNKRRISDTEAWSFYMEAFENGEYTFRHDKKNYVLKCGQKPEVSATLTEVQLQCNMLENHVGSQLVGKLDMTTPSAQLTFDGFRDIGLTVLSVR